MSIKKTYYLFWSAPIEYCSIVIFSIGISLLSFMQIYFHEIYQYSIMQSSLLLGAATTGQLIGSMYSKKYVHFMTKIIKRCHLKVCPMRLSICLLSIAISSLFIIFNFNQQYRVFIFISFFLGVLLALFSPINMAILTTDVDLSEAARITFLRRWTLNMGACIGFAVMGYLIYSPKQIYYSVAICFLLIGIFEFIALFRMNKHQPVVKSQLSNVSGIQFAYHSKSVWLWMLGVFLSYIIFFQTISTYPIFLKDYANISAVEFSRLMVVSVVTLLCLQFITPLLDRYIKISTISALGTFFIGIGISMVAVPSHSIIIISVIVWSIGEICLLGVTPIYAKIFAGNDLDKNLQYSSNYYVLCYLGKIIGPVGGSFLYSWIPWHKSFLLFFLFLSMVVGVCFYQLGKMVPDKVSA